MSMPDKRLNPYRDDIAADFLKGQVESRSFTEGVKHCIKAPLANLHHEPSSTSAIDSQALMGDCFTVFEEKNGWSWGQLQSDGYVGYIESVFLDQWTVPPTHRVNVLRTFLYPGPNMKLVSQGFVTLNAGVNITSFEGDFARTMQGHYIFKEHLSPWSTPLAYDYVKIAELFIATPYLWGGRSSIGIDCSGLVQMSLTASGKPALRDTDMQERTIGVPVEFSDDLSGLKRGDLVFWKGHVAIMASSSTILHATAHHMMTFKEPLAKADKRIQERKNLKISSIRRLKPE